MLQALPTSWNVAFDHIFSGEQAGPRICLPLEAAALMSQRASRGRLSHRHHGG
ncbi:MAG: hypothetical protein Q9O62_13115 [Ardenticatenia bacterium]|nr:hypothetical protein [Ardenticatenia bacterium]